MRTFPCRSASSAAAFTVVFVGAGGALAQSAGDSVDLGQTFEHRIDGVGRGDDTGDRAANAGDVNRDGREDVVLGAYRADPAGRTNAGAAYIVISSDAKRVRLRTDRGRVVEIRGAHKGDEAGLMVKGIGDVNGDGRADQAVGSYTATAAGARRPARSG